MTAFWSDQDMKKTIEMREDVKVEAILESPPKVCTLYKRKFQQESYMD